MTVCSGGVKRTISLKISDKENLSGGANQQVTNEGAENAEIAESNGTMQTTVNQ